MEIYTFGYCPHLESSSTIYSVNLVLIIKTWLKKWVFSWRPDNTPDPPLITHCTFSLFPKIDSYILSFSLKRVVCYNENLFEMTSLKVSCLKKSYFISNKHNFSKRFIVKRSLVQEILRVIWHDSYLPSLLLLVMYHNINKKTLGMRLYNW